MRVFVSEGSELLDRVGVMVAVGVKISEIVVDEVNVSDTDVESL